MFPEPKSHKQGSPDIRLKRLVNSLLKILQVQFISHSDLNKNITKPTLCVALSACQTAEWDQTSVINMSGNPNCTSRAWNCRKSAQKPKTRHLVYLVRVPRSSVRPTDPSCFLMEWLQVCSE